MLGNCATGRLTIVTAPMTTVRMAMTIATIGRLMKNRDIRLPFSLHCGLWGVRARVDADAHTNLLHSLGDDAFARCKAISYQPHGADALADLHAANAHRVVL